MKINVFSDLHLEFRNSIAQFEAIQKIVANPDVDLNINAGDTHPSSLVRDYFASDIPNYFEVLGNHDYYGAYLSGCHSVTWVKDVKVVGATLWTDFKKNNPLVKHNCVDKGMIKCPENIPLGDIIYEQHKIDLEFIYREKPHVVVSHHCPSIRSCHPRYYSSGDFNYNFLSDLDNFILDNPNIRLWIHGHTHDSYDYMLGSCRVVCNPLGYPNQNYSEDSLYKGKVIDV